ncbi:hypothetical protein ABPG74_013678 [Tetrahymena malaccensis]
MSTYKQSIFSYPQQSLVSTHKQSSEENKTQYFNQKKDENTNQNIQNVSLTSLIKKKIFYNITVKNIISVLQIEESCFDSTNNMTWEKNNSKCYIGNINGQNQEYHLPVGYYGLGLNVLNTGRYPNDGWLNCDTKDATWIVLFHSATPQAVGQIIRKGFKAGNGQFYQDQMCRFGRGKIGKGVYFSNEIQYCEKYGGNIQVGYKYFRLIFECRVNPKTVKSPVNKKEYYIVNDLNDMRPYRLLIKEEDSIKNDQISNSYSYSQTPNQELMD